MQPVSFGRRTTAPMPRPIAHVPSGSVAEPPYVAVAAPMAARGPVATWIDDAVAFLFSPKGRMPRWQYRLTRLGLAGMCYVIAQLMLLYLKSVKIPSAGPDLLLTLGYELAALLAMLGFVGVCVWSGVVLTIKRWHDLDRSAWWVLLGCIPIVGWIAQMVMCNFFAGTPGPNRYGPMPRRN